MSPNEIADLGLKLGLDVRFISDNYVTFDLANGQVYGIVSPSNDDDVYSHLGKALISKGKILKKLEINRILSITDGD